MRAVYGPVLLVLAEHPAVELRRVADRDQADRHCRARRQAGPQDGPEQDPAAGANVYVAAFWSHSAALPWSVAGQPESEREPANAPRR